MLKLNHDCYITSIIEFPESILNSGEREVGGRVVFFFLLETSLIMVIAMSVQKNLGPKCRRTLRNKVQAKSLENFDFF